MKNLKELLCANVVVFIISLFMRVNATYEWANKTENERIGSVMAFGTSTVFLVTSIIFFAIILGVVLFEKIKSLK